MCLDRILPPRRERPLRFALPPMRAADDAVDAMAALVAALANAEITAGEAAELARMVEAFVRSLESREFDPRLHFLEARQTDARP